MKKGAMSNILQRCLILCCVMLVAMTVVFTRGNEAKAWNKKGNNCTLQSITLEIEGKEYKYEGELTPLVVVEQDKDWAEFLSTIKIVDFEVVTSDTCTCENHDALSLSLYGDYDYHIANDFVAYQGGVSTNMLQVDNTLDIGTYGFYDIYFDDDWGYIDIFFTKEYALDYELDGGAFPEGIEVPTTYNSVDQITLPIPEREGYIFTGWTNIEDDTPAIKTLTGYGMTGDVTYTAHWTEGERIDISTISTLVVEYDEEHEYSGQERQPWVDLYDSSSDEDLKQGTDYIVSYKNNIEVADANSETPPTIIIKGVGEYKGTIEKTFTIEKGTLWWVDPILYIGKGDALSTMDLSEFKAYAYSNDKVVPGTWIWDAPDTIVDAEIGEEVYYWVTFTPTDTENYEVLTTSVYLIVKASMKDWEISFADEETLSYTGEAHKPAVTVVSGETTMKEGTDYSVSYVNNVNVGDKSDENAPTVVVEGKGDYVGTKKLTFTIEKGTPTVETTPVASAIEDGQKLSDATLTGGKVVNAKGKVLEGEFSWKDGTAIPTLADSGVTKYTVVFTPKDTNYKTMETTVVVTVNKKEEASTPAPTPTPDLQPTPTPAPQPTPDPEPIITVGEKMADKDNKATYQVVKSEEGKVEVSYVAPTSKKTTVSIPATVTLAGGTTAKVTSISAKAFKGNTKIETVTISKNVKTIGKEAFSGCKNLKKVKGAANVTSIGKNAFANCTKLTSVAMGSKVTSISEKAFYKCTKLEKITIPKNVKSIGKSAFQGCKKLKNITIKTTKLTKKNVKKNAFKGIYSKAKIDVPNSKKKTYTSMLRSKGVSKNATIK